MSSPKEIRAELLQALEEFSAMQAEHLELFKGGKLAKVELWRNQQAKAAARLKQCFEKYNGSGSAELDPEFHEYLLARLADTLDGGRKLCTEVEGRKESVRGQICKLRKGKRVVKGYSTYGTSRAGPRYFSSRR